MIWIPSTDIQPYKQWNLGSESLLYTNDGATGAFVDESVLYGVLPRVEAGLDIVSPYETININGTPSNPFWWNAKYLVVPPEKQRPFALAVGIYSTTIQPSANAQLVYGVASYTFKRLRATAGIYGGVSGIIGQENAGYLLGLDYPVRQWWYAMDYQSGRNPFGAWNIGVGYYFTKKLKMVVGYDLYNAPAVLGAHGSFTFAVSYNL